MNPPNKRYLLAVSLKDSKGTVLHGHHTVEIVELNSNDERLWFEEVTALCYEFEKGLVDPATKKKRRAGITVQNCISYFSSAKPHLKVECYFSRFIRDNLADKWDHRRIQNMKKDQYMPHTSELGLIQSLNLQQEKDKCLTSNSNQTYTQFYINSVYIRELNTSGKNIWEHKLP